MTTDEIIDEILAAEGGYVDDATDRGGCTNYGITRETLSAHLGYRASCDDVAALTEAEARVIYRDRYVERPKLDELPARLRPLMVDSAVQHGVERAIRWLQKAAGTTADGIIGPVTLEAVSDAHLDGLFRRVLAKRIRFYFAIIHDDPSQARFANGWGARVTKWLEV